MEDFKFFLGLALIALAVALPAMVISCSHNSSMEKCMEAKIDLEVCNKFLK